MLEHTAALALEVGVANFTIDELARRSGVAKTTIYRHFPTRQELLVAALDGQIPRPRVPDTGTFRADLIEFLHEIRPFFRNESIRRIALDILALSTRDPEAGAWMATLADGRSEPLRLIIERAQARGEVRTDLAPLILMELIEGPLFMRSVMWPHEVDELDLEAHADRVITVLEP